MALLGGRCVADADCVGGGAARGSVCGREHGRCECGRGTEFDIATQECRGEQAELTVARARFAQPLTYYEDLFLIAHVVWLRDVRASAAAEVQ